MVRRKWLQAYDARPARVTGCTLRPRTVPSQLKLHTAVMAQLHVLRSAGYATAPWKNGAGTTREVARDAAAVGDDGWRWRVSIADVVTDGPFSIFPGTDRILTLIEPAGVLLTVDGVEHGLAYLEPFAFPGDAATTARLSAGPTRDLNVMANRDTTRATIEIVTFTTGSTMTAGPAETLLVVVVAGAATVVAGPSSVDLVHLDALQADADTTVSLTAAGAATAAVVRLATR
jgi:uncharacterized protein